MPIRMENDRYEHWRPTVYCDGCGKKIDDLNLAYFAYDSMGPDTPRDIYFCHQHNRCPDLIQNKIIEKAGEEGRKYHCNWLAFGDFYFAVMGIAPKRKKEEPPYQIHAYENPTKPDIKQAYENLTKPEIKST